MTSTQDRCGLLSSGGYTIDVARHMDAPIAYCSHHSIREHFRAGMRLMEPLKAFHRPLKAFKGLGKALKAFEKLFRSLEKAIVVFP